MPKEPAIYVAIADVFFKSGKIKDALYYYDLAKDLDPKFNALLKDKYDIIN